MPLIVLDVAATAIAFIVAAWGTGVLGFVLDMHGFAAYLACLAIINVAVFATGRMYNTLWEYASIDELVRVVVVTLLAAVIGDAFTALVFGQRLPFRVYVVSWFVLLLVCGASRFAIRLYSGAKGWSVFGIKEKSGLPAP